MSFPCNCPQPDVETCPPYVSLNTFLNFFQNSCGCVSEEIVDTSVTLVNLCDAAYPNGAPECCDMYAVERSDGSICISLQDCQSWTCMNSGGGGCTGFMSVPLNPTQPGVILDDAFGGSCPSNCDFLTVEDSDGTIWISANRSGDCTDLTWCKLCSVPCDILVPDETATSNFLSFFSTQPTEAQCPHLRVCYDGSSGVPAIKHCWTYANSGNGEWLPMDSGKYSVAQLSLPQQQLFSASAVEQNINMTSVPSDQLQIWNGTGFTLRETGVYTVNLQISLCDTTLVGDRCIFVLRNGLRAGAGCSPQSASESGRSVLSVTFTQLMGAGDVLQAAILTPDADACVSEVQFSIVQERPER